MLYLIYVYSISSIYIIYQPVTLIILCHDQSCGLTQSRHRNKATAPPSKTRHWKNHALRIRKMYINIKIRFSMNTGETHTFTIVTYNIVYHIVNDHINYDYMLYNIILYYISLYYYCYCYHCYYCCFAIVIIISIHRFLDIPNPVGFKS